MLSRVILCSKRGATLKKKILLFIFVLVILLGEGVIGFAFLNNVNTVRDSIIKLSDVIISQSNGALFK